MGEGQISRKLSDVESLCGFRSKKFTYVNPFFSHLVGTAIFALIYLSLSFFRGHHWAADMFFHGGREHRSMIPYFTVFLGCWALAMLLIKMQKLHVQRMVLKLNLLPDDTAFVLTCATARTILEKINLTVSDPADFVLLDRIQRALVNLKNLGNVSAVAECLNTQAKNDEEYLAGSYTILKGFIWAIPVLGFIGTVLGLAGAMGDFGALINKGVTPQELFAALGNVTGGLSVAFETTLIALVIALLIQLLMTLVLNREELFLDECSDYCHRYLISRIKSLDLAKEEE